MGIRDALKNVSSTPAASVQQGASQGLNNLFRATTNREDLDQLAANPNWAEEEWAANRGAINIPEATPRIPEKPEPPTLEEALQQISQDPGIQQIAQDPGVQEAKTAWDQAMQEAQAANKSGLNISGVSEAPKGTGGGRGENEPYVGKSKNKVTFVPEGIMGYDVPIVDPAWIFRALQDKTDEMNSLNEIAKIQQNGMLSEEEAEDVLRGIETPQKIEYWGSKDEYLAANPYRGTWTHDSVDPKTNKKITQTAWNNKQKAWDEAWDDSKENGGVIKTYQAPPNLEEIDPNSATIYSDEEVDRDEYEKGSTGSTPQLDVGSIEYYQGSQGAQFDAWAATDEGKAKLKEWGIDPEGKYTGTDLAYTNFRTCTDPDVWYDAAMTIPGWRWRYEAEIGEDLSTPEGRLAFEQYLIGNSISLNDYYEDPVAYMSGLNSRSLAGDAWDAYLALNYLYDDPTVAALLATDMDPELAAMRQWDYNNPYNQVWPDLSTGAIADKPNMNKRMIDRRRRNASNTPRQNTVNSPTAEEAYNYWISQGATDEEAKVLAASYPG